MAFKLKTAQKKNFLTFNQSMATKLRAPTWRRYFYSYRPVEWTGPFIFVVCATRLLKDLDNMVAASSNFKKQVK